MHLKQINKEEIKGKTGAFFNSQRWKNILLFFSFILLASGFWALQYFHQTFEFEVPIRLDYENIPIEVVLSDQLPQEISLHVQDRGSAFLNYLIKRGKQALFISINLEDISSRKTSYVISQAELRNLILEKLFSTTLLKSFSPEKIEIEYSPLAKKELPVTINGTIFPAFGYLFLDSIRINPKLVMAYGSKSALDTLREIQTIPLNYTITDTEWTAQVDLQTPKGIRLIVDQVKLNASIEEYTEKTFELPVVCYNLPSNCKIHFFPSTVELGVKVGLSKYSQLSQSNFEIALNYNDLKGKTTANCSITLTRKPLGLDKYRIAPDVIEFLIEQKVTDESSRTNRRDR